MTVMANDGANIPIAEVVGQRFIDHEGLPADVPKAVHAFRAGVAAYLCGSWLGEHLNCHLFVHVAAELEQGDCDLTEAQKDAFLAFLEDQVPEFEADLCAFVEAASYDFDAEVVAFIEDLTTFESRCGSGTA